MSDIAELSEAFAARVIKRIDFRGDDECWPWIGERDSKGYGSFRLCGRNRTRRITGAHRIVYRLLAGDFPHDLTIDHLCRNHICVNPKHLEPVPFAVNNARSFSASAVHARKTMCPNGHPYDAIKTNGNKGLVRFCRQCRDANRAEYKRRTGR